MEETFQQNETEINITLEAKINQEEEEAITSVTSKQVVIEIKINLNPKKAPGYNLIAGELLKQLF